MFSLVEKRVSADGLRYHKGMKQVSEPRRAPGAPLDGSGRQGLLASTISCAAREIRKIVWHN